MTASAGICAVSSSVVVLTGAANAEDAANKTAVKIEGNLILLIVYIVYEIDSL